ncbi:hypothetical protein CLOM_g1826 [Closterium sp. NIES-68]|nr:hypothetical protein CLOM_g1826 [Closterium sp. NIES-68]
MRSVAVSSAIRTIGRLPWITATVAPPATRVATTAFEALQPCRNAFANPFANPFANRRLSLASVSRIFMASAGDSVSHATSAANHHPAHVSQADQPTLANPPKSVAGNPSSPTKQGEAATKVPGKRLIGRMEGSDPFALLKALAPMQVLIGAGMLTALILPRPLALALTAAALLPPILRTALHSWRWGGARKGVYREGTSGESRERGEEKGAKGKAQFEREGLLGEVVPEAGEAVGKGKSEGEGWVATAGSDGKQNGVGGRHEAARVGNLLSVNGMDIFKGRMAGKMDGDFCLFLIGARANNPFPLGPSFASVGEVFQQAVRELEQETDKFGYLGGTTMWAWTRHVAHRHWLSCFGALMTIWLRTPTTRT